MEANASLIWFCLLSLLTALALVGGLRLGRSPLWMGRCGVLLAICLIVTWAYLMRRPSLAVRLLPLGVLSRIEGVGSVPLFMLILGYGWSRAHLPRQRVLVAWAMMFGVVYFINGSRWLLQETPSAVMGHVAEAPEVRQSQDYTCVPAACATALNLQGFPSTEALMARLTLTRPGSGATMIRAMDGLSRRLDGVPVRPTLLELPADQLHRLPMPLLTPLQFEPGRRHMVTLTRIRRGLVRMVDPMVGYRVMSYDEFDGVYRGQVIAFDRID